MFWRLVARIALAILSLRYSIEVRGLSELARHRFARKGGLLFLPNHTALIDPVFLCLLLWPRYRLRPLVVEYIYRMKFLRPLVRLVRAISVPDFESAVNPMKLRRGDLSMHEIAAGLAAGDHFLFYPSGRLKLGAREVIGGASGAHALVEASPEANVVLVRTSGLWGSSFSRAIEGRVPSIVGTVWHGMKCVLKNLVFFSPRRKVVIELVPEPANFPRGATRIQFNRYLEQWYNQSVEKISLVSYSRWHRDVPVPFEEKKKTSSSNNEAISNEIRRAVFDEIRHVLDRPDISVEEPMSLALDLGLDSLNMAELIAFLSAKYEAGRIRPEEIETVRDALEVAAGMRNGAREQTPASTFHWPKEPRRPAPNLPEGSTIPEAFLRSCKRMGSWSAAGDDTSGVQTYRRLSKAVRVLAESFRSLDGRFVGVLLPASTASYLTIVALQLAGKVPVMLNWTLGPKYLEEMVRASGVKKVVSSWRFIDRLAHVDLGTVADKLVLLEDVREKLSLFTKLRGLMRTPAVLDENSPAVILFTSGTEAAPKGVPLTHKNIVSNLRCGLQCIDMRPTDVMYGVLPPFHSFGFTVAGLAAMLVGMRIAFYPDPTDSFALAEGIHRWQATIFCSAPSFLKGLFQAAKPAQLVSVRMFVSGAEKTPAELYDKVDALKSKAKLIEGYGITECSPILTLVRPNLPPVGVGMPIPGVELITVHPETGERLAEGQEGEVCVHGPNVFHGYLDPKAKSPFLELQGKRWYRTGDLGKVDGAGNLILSGRLKRFMKLGGEMISLGAVEDALSKEPGLAVVVDERVEGKPQLVVFTTQHLSVNEANDRLRASGLSRLVKIANVIPVDEIPLMGTGKTDYRKLQTKLPPL